MKKVLQHFLGKTMILVSLLFAFNQKSIAQITISTANCVITANEVQMDIKVTNTGTGDLRWNSTVIRMTVPASMLPSPVTLGTYSFQYVGGSDFPLSWPTVIPSNAAGASFTTSSRLLTWTTGSPGAYNNLTPNPCEAPLIAAGVTKTIGRFSFKILTGGNFIAGQPATFTWSTTSSCNLYQVCAGAVTGYNSSSSGVALRTLGPVCPLTVPGSCAVTGSSVVTNPACFGGTGSAVVTLTGTGAGAPGTYTVDGGAAIPYSSNPFTVTGLSATNHNIVATVTAGGCISSSIAANVTQPTQLVASASAGTIACFGGTTTVVVSATGGTPGYTGTGSFTVSAGPYSFTVTDANGCTSIASGTIANGAALTGSSSGSTAPTCAAGTNGTSIITLSSVSTLQGSQQVPPVASPATGTIISTFNSTTSMLTLNITFSGLIANTTDAHIHLGAAGANGGVQFGLVSTIGFPQGVTSGAASGSILLTAGQAASLLAGNYYVNIHTTANPGGEIRSQLSVSTSGIYTVDGGSAQSYSSNPFTVSGLSSGSHTVVATSVAGCLSNSIAVSIGSTAALTGSGTTTPATTCIPGNEGTATITLSASTSGTYTVDGGSAQSYSSNPFTITGLTAGNHTIVATSAAGCVSNSIAVTVGAAGGLTGTASGTAVSCFGATDGTATVTLSASTSGTYTVDGGTPQSYSSNPFTITGLAAGSHTIVATSAAGCVSSLIGVTVGSTAQLTGSGTTTPTTCGNPTSGTATITLSASTS